MADYVKAFGSALYGKRIASGLTQEALSEKLHMSKKTVAKAESGEKSPRFETVAIISSELSISLDALILEKVDETSVPHCVMDFFSEMSPSVAEKYIALCRQVRELSES